MPSLPLQEAYEREEVLTPVHRSTPRPAGPRLPAPSSGSSSSSAEEGGVIVGKAGTNARGFRVDQMGGVYTLPARRGRGRGRGLDGRSSSPRSARRGQAARPLRQADERGRPAPSIGASASRTSATYRADYFEA